MAAPPNPPRNRRQVIAMRRESVYGVDRFAQASLTTAQTGNRDIRLVAVATGTGGNAITLVLEDPAGNNVPLSVAVVGNAITVTLATDGSSHPTSTGAQV